MKVFVGHVVATKTAKTAVVTVDRVVIHPLYKKRFRRDKKYQVHDEIGVKVGDLVNFAASKPYSKTKKWKILGKTVVKTGKVAVTAKAEKKGKAK